MSLKFPAGTTSRTKRIFIRDTLDTAKIAGLTGLVYNSSGLTAYYIREGGTATSITLATAVVGTWTSGGFIEVDSTNMPGIYEIGIPDAALATGAEDVVILLKGATNMEQVQLEIDLNVDSHVEKAGGQTVSATATVDFDDLAAILVDTNSLNDTKIPQTLNLTASGNIGIDLANVENPTTTLALTNTTVGTVTTNTDMRGTDNAFLAASAPSNFSSLGINVSGHISRVTLVDTVTTNTDMRGTDSALLAANVPANFTDLAITATTGLVSVGTNNDKSGYSLTQAFPANFETLGINVSGHISRVTLVDTTTTNTDMRGTDGANTVIPNTIAPDNAGIAANAAAIAGLNDISSADVLTQVGAGLVAIHLDHFFAAAYDPATKPGVAGGLMNILVEDDAGVPRYTVNALEQAPSGGGGGGDASAANQTIIIDHLNDIKGAGWVPADNLAEIAEDVAGLNGSAMRGTDSAFLAASAPSNFSSMLISIGGVVASDAIAISGSVTEADHLETILVASPAAKIAADAVATVPDPVNANITQVAGQTASATGPVDFDTVTIGGGAASGSGNSPLQTQKGPVVVYGKKDSDVLVLAQIKDKTGTFANAGQAGSVAAVLKQDFPPFTTESPAATDVSISNTILGTIANPDARWPAHLHGNEGYNATITFQSSFFTQNGRYRGTVTFDELSTVFEIMITD